MKPAVAAVALTGTPVHVITVNDYLARRDGDTLAPLYEAFGLSVGIIHADMSPKEFGESMKNNEESVSKMVLRAMGQSMAMQSRGRGGEAGVLLALFSKNKTLRLRRAIAEQMQNMEGGMIMFEGKDGSTIIDHRNAKAMEILKREIAAGNKKVAIFYGAGHLPDMQRRLLSDFKMQRAGQFWLDAWKLTNREFKR